MRGIVLGLSAVALAMSGAVGAKDAPIMPPMVASGRAVHIKTKAYDLYYSYPAAAGRIPALKSWLDADLLRKRAQIIKDTAQELKDAGGDAEMASHFMMAEHWNVVANLPGWISLSSQIRYLSGGAHSNYHFDTVLWDKAAGRPRRVTDLFSSPQALSAAVRQPFCDALNTRLAERGITVLPGEKAAECYDPVSEEVVILGSADHRHFTRIGFLIAPYEIGSFADGAFQMTLPVTPAVLAAVKPQYRAAFALGPQRPLAHLSSVAPINFSSK